MTTQGEAGFLLPTSFQRTACVLPPQYNPVNFVAYFTDENRKPDIISKLHGKYPTTNYCTVYSPAKQIFVHHLTLSNNYYLPAEILSRLVSDQQHHLIAPLRLN